MTTIAPTEISPLPIYPSGQHFALSNPDGPVLRNGETVILHLAGQHILGQVHWSERGDFFRAEDHTICGLYPEMRVALPSAIRRRRSYRARFRWTSQLQQHLIERYLELSTSAPQAKRTGLYAIGRRIAEEQGWPVQAVQSKLYLLRQELARRRRVVLWHRQTRLQQEQQRTQAPVSLTPGAYLWPVQVGTVRATWLLDFPYGTCSLLPGQRCFYKGQLYVVERVYSAQLVVRLAPADPASLP